MRILNPLTFPLALLLLVATAFPATAEPPAKPVTPDIPTDESPTVVIPIAGLFVGNSAELTIGARQIAARWAATLSARSGWARIEHHSAIGDSNLRMSQARADAFAAVLSAKDKKLRLVSIGYADTRPTKENSDPRLVLDMRSGKPPARTGRTSITFEKDPTTFDGDALFAAAGADGRKSYRRALAKHYGLTRKNNFRSNERGIAFDPKTTSVYLAIRRQRGMRPFKGLLPMRVLPTFTEQTIRGRYKHGRAVDGAYQVIVRGQILQFFFDKGQLSAMRLLGQP